MVRETFWFENRRDRSQGREEMESAKGALHPNATTKILKIQMYPILLSDLVSISHGGGLK